MVERVHEDAGGLVIRSQDASVVQPGLERYVLVEDLLAKPALPPLLGGLHDSEMPAHTVKGGARHTCTVETKVPQLSTNIGRC